LLAEKRRRGIFDAVNNNGSISNVDLARQFRVSVETIRRDIIRLNKNGLLRRTHGGALSMNSFEPAYADRMSENIESKREIAQTAASLVPDNAKVIIDFGTTAMCVAEALEKHNGLTVVTASLKAANFLSGRNGNEVILLGGQLDASEGATLGRDTTKMLETYFVDYSFIGAGVISPHPWLMDFSREAAELRALMLTQANTSVVLADHTKFNRTAAHRVANFERAGFLITDRKFDAAISQTLSSFEGEILITEP
jgi:DeoR family transcriptional regulator, glycerol-3-phosphate regulon repressor